MLVDFFAAIEDTQPTMFNPTTNRYVCVYLDSLSSCRLLARVCFVVLGSCGGFIMLAKSFMREAANARPSLRAAAEYTLSCTVPWNAAGSTYDHESVAGVRAS